MLWPLLFRSLRAYAPYITLPFAALVGFVGYNLENIISDKYTPYNDSIKEKRNERLSTEESLNAATNIQKAKYKYVLDTNISPSLK